MTDLQMGLIGLGAVAVVGVFGYNKWQEYRHRKLAEKVLEASHADVLLDATASDGVPGGYSEPADGLPEGEPLGQEPMHFAADPAEPVGTVGSFRASPTIPEFHDERVEPGLRREPQLREPGLDPRDAQGVEPARSLDRTQAAGLESPAVVAPVPEATAEPIRPDEPADEPVPEPKAPRKLPEPAHLLSPMADYIATIEAVDPAPAYQILEAQHQGLTRISKPIHWLGFNEGTQEWDVIVDDGRSAYRIIRVGLQLADRQGPVSDMELAAFQNAMQGLADELMAMAEIPSRPATLKAAGELDAFCAGVDIQIGVNVIAQGQVFQGTKLRALAEAAGMVIDGDGRFVRCDEDGNILYVLLNQGERGFSGESMKTMTTNGLTFLLDVPRVAHGERVFAQMVDQARRFADTLRGAMVDDNRRPLSESALEPIRKQIGQYQAAMAAHQLPAGGPVARRLFS